MDDALLSTAEKVTKNLLESHFEGKASFPQISAQRRTSMDDSEYVQILIVFDGDMEIIDDPLWYKHDWHAKVDDLFEDDLSVVYKLDKSKYTKRDNQYLDRRIDELYDQVCKA